MPPPKSKCWISFTKLDNNRAQCKLCLTIIKTSGNTTNLTKHLKIAHSPETSKTMNTKYFKQEQTSTSTSASVSLPSSMQSLTPGIFDTETLSQEQKEMKGPLPAVLSRAVSYSSGGSRHEKLTESILYFICQDNRPFDVVKGKGFIRMMKMLAPMYKLPCTDTFKSRLDLKYEALHVRYKEKFATVHYFSLTCDIWSDMCTCRSYLGVTVHFIENNHLKGMTVGVEELSERHTADYISECLSNVCLKWNIALEKVVAVTTDSGANIVSAVAKVFEKNRHINCFAHLINLVADNVLNQTDCRLIIIKVREIVLYIKKSIVINDLMRKKQSQIGLIENKFKKVILDCKTRWNSTYYMLVRFVELSSIIGEIFLTKPNAPPMPTAVEVLEIKELIQLLKPLEYVTLEMSGEHYVTISKVLPIVSCMKNQYEVMHFDSEKTTNLKTIVLKEIAKRFGNIEFVSIFAKATILDPRFKNIHFQDPKACSSAMWKLRSDINTCSSSSDSDNDTADVSNENATTYDFWGHHKSLAHGSEARKKRKTDNVTVRDELSVYLGNPVCPLSVDPLKQWEEMKLIFPGLYNQAQKYFSIVATSVPAERLFSKAGITLTHRRNRLSGKRLSKLLFLSSLEESEWF